MRNKIPVRPKTGYMGKGDLMIATPEPVTFSVTRSVKKRTPYLFGGLAVLAVVAEEKISSFKVPERVTENRKPIFLLNLNEIISSYKLLLYLQDKFLKVYNVLLDN